MARPSVDVHPDATAEAGAAFLWYSERNPLAASTFISELDHAVREIRNFPERWPRYLHGTRKFLFRRVPLLRDLPRHRRGHSSHRRGQSTASAWLLENQTTLEPPGPDQLFAELNRSSFKNPEFSAIATHLVRLLRPFCLFIFALPNDSIRFHQRPLRDRDTDLFCRLEV